ncbi:MAG: hypothetical protein KIS79_09825 [Burkholderiales bacterium]|nr:hypothetical protein [Burkholderiales bacterium]
MARAALPSRRRHASAAHQTTNPSTQATQACYDPSFESKAADLFLKL